jgi:hypothetical protein
MKLSSTVIPVYLQAKSGTCLPAGKVWYPEFTSADYPLCQKHNETSS